MLRILWNSKSAMMANQDMMDAISNNIANSNTEGYKRVKVNFKDLVYETLDRSGYPVSDNKTRGQEPFTGTGVRSSGWIRDDSQGSVMQTQNSTDFAIDGEGYFRVTRPDGSTAYTRNGEFATDAEGRLTDGSGNIVNIEYNAGVNPADIKLYKGNFIVQDNGDLVMNYGGKVQTVGKIPIYSAVGADAFTSIGDNLYVPTSSATVQQVSDPSILQGYVEGSNVDIAKEMTDMIVTQRAFQLGSKGIQTADEMWGIANNIRGK